MSRFNLLLLLFSLSIIIYFAGAMLKVLHISALGEFVAMLSIFARTAFSLMVIIEVINSQRLSIIEKIMWIACLIPIYFVTGILYLIVGRPRIMKEYKMLNL